MMTNPTDAIREALIRDILNTDDGAGSDLDTADWSEHDMDPFIYVMGNLDVDALASTAAAAYAGWLKDTADAGRAALAAEPHGWVDNQGDVWVALGDGLLHSPECRPFTPEHVEKKWGPLEVLEHTDGGCRVCDARERVQP